MSKKLHIVMIALLLIGAVAWAGPLQSKFATSSDGSAVALNFAGVDTGWTIKSIYAKVVTAGAATAQIEILQRTGSALNPTAAPTSGATVISVANTGTAIAQNDLVMYSYSDGAAPLYTTASTSTATSVTLATGITQTGTVNDRLYEVTTNGVIVIGTTAFNQDGPVMFATPSDSPLRVRINSGTNISLTVTAAKE